MSTQLAGGPDRAGTVVREHVTSVIEAARGAAVEIERKAMDAAEEDRHSAHAHAQGVLNAALAVENELTVLHMAVGREADALRAKLDRTLRLSAGATVPSRPALGAEQPRQSSELASGESDESLRLGLSTGSGEGSAVDEVVVAERAVRQDDPAPEPAENLASKPPNPEPGGQETDQSVPVEDEGVPPTAGTAPVIDQSDSPTAEEAVAVEEGVVAEEGVAAEEVVAEEEEVGAEEAVAAEEGVAAEEAVAGEEEVATDEGPSAEEPVRLPSGGAEAANLEEEARSRVATQTDSELAELYKIATHRASQGPDDERDYWAALESAAVLEAAARPEFGQIREGEEPGGRRAKKRRSSLFRPLMAARQVAREGTSEDAS